MSGRFWRVGSRLLWLLTLRTFTKVGLLVWGLLWLLPLRCLFPLVGFQSLDGQLFVELLHYSALVY